MILTWKNSAWDFKDHSPQIAVLPLANLNCHGSNLPDYTDQLIVTEIARRVSELLPVTTFLLPTWPLGTAMSKNDQVASISLEAETLWAVVHDIILSLYDHGIKQIVVINNHGSIEGSSAWPTSNTVVKTAIRQLNYETAGLTAIWVQPFVAGRSAFEKLFPGIQNDEIELMLCEHLTSNAEKQNQIFQKTGISPAQSSREPSHDEGKTALDVLVHATVEYIEHTLTQISEIKKNK
jgi:creatinine amidohydrolase/Fe(II)-dependent formamide hydrolase-like protein